MHILSEIIRHYARNEPPTLGSQVLSANYYTTVPTQENKPDINRMLHA